MNALSGLARVLIFGGAIGLGASLFAIGFVEAVKWLSESLLITVRARRDAPAHWSLWLILVPAIAGLLAGLLIRLIAERRAHNPADAIEAAQLLREVPTRSGLLTAAAALIGLGGGASVGQYGPLVHLGATVGSMLSRFGERLRVGGAIDPGLGIGCGVAAAISTAFNAPIAGIIFAHEVVLRHYSLRAFAPIMVASSTGLFIATRVFDRPALFEIDAAHSALPAEFLAFIFIGASGALVAVAYMRAILAAQHLSEPLTMPDWLKPALAGLCVGLCAHWIPEILGAGGETLRLAITPGAYDAAQLALILVLKIAATALCLGFGFAGGVLSPALLIGALFGALVGDGAQAIAGALSDGGGIISSSGFEFYAICGLAAVTSPVIGAPLATILIVFELTRNYELTTAVMIAVAFSNVVGYRLFGRSLFDRQLAMRGFDLSLGRDKVHLARSGIREYLSDDFVRARDRDRAADVQRALIAAQSSEAHVVDDRGRYVGTIALPRLIARTHDDDGGDADQRSARDVMHDDALRFDSGMSVWAAMEAMESFVGESIPVLDRDGALLGVVHESTLVRAYLRTVHKLREAEHAG
ncbi:MAG: chloride channel protein [bacterium]